MSESYPKPDRKPFLLSALIALLCSTILMALVSIPGEYRSHSRLPFYNAHTSEHGWPAVWLDRQSIEATTTVRPPSPGWQKKVVVAKEEFKQRCDDLPEFRWAETETDFSPQFYPGTADQFWSLSDGWPLSKGVETFYRLRLWGLLFDLAIWLLGSIAIFYGLQTFRARATKRLQLSIRTGLLIVVILSLLGAGYTYFDRQRNREQATVENTQREASISFDFTGNVPAWLDRVTDYRWRPYWLSNSFRRGIKHHEVKAFGLFDRVLAIRLNGWEGGDMVPLIREPAETARAINQLDHLENIWVMCREDQSIDQFLSRIDGQRISWLNFDRQFQFDPHKTRVTHFTNLEGLYIENGTHIPAGFINSFPKLKILTLRADTIDAQVIDEILALKDLEQLAVGKFLKNSLSRDQQNRLRDASDSFDLYIQ